MRVSRKALFLATALAVASLQADAQPGSQHWQVHQPTRFVAAGVLRKNDVPDVVVKAVQGIVTADDAKVAAGLFRKSVADQYPGYTLLDTTVMPVPATGSCETSI